jgi:hypothetical protein
MVAKARLWQTIRTTLPRKLRAKEQGKLKRLTGFEQSVNDFVKTTYRR